MAVGIHHPEIPPGTVRRAEGDPPAVRRPDREAVFAGPRGQPGLGPAVGVHAVDLPVAVAPGGKGDTGRVFDSIGARAEAEHGQGGKGEKQAR